MISVDAKAEIADLQNQFATLAETSAVSEKSKQNVRKMLPTF